MTEEIQARIRYDMLIARYLRAWYEQEGYVLDTETLDILARKADVALFRMENYFLRKISTRPECWKNYIRVGKAMEMMYLHPEISILKIGYSVGFYDKSSIHRAFLKAEGVPPQDYEKSLHFCRLLLYFKVSR